MRWVLDTNVVASALLWDGNARVLLTFARDEDFQLFTSAPLLSELTDILSRRKFQQKIAAPYFQSTSLWIVTRSWLLWCGLQRYYALPLILMTMW